MNSVIDHFSSLFTKEDVFFNCWPSYRVCHVPSNKHQDLCKLPNSKEIEQTIKEMNPWKALGLGGVHVAFFQHFWEIIKSGVTSHIVDMFAGINEIGPCNQTIFHLLPKQKRPKFPAD